MLQLSTDGSFHFEILRDLAATPYGGADIGEVLLAAAKIDAGNFESFSSTFDVLANRVYSTAKSIDSSRFPVSAREAFFRAATYFRSADFYLHGNWSDPRINSLWTLQETAYHNAISLLASPPIRVNITGDDFYIPAIFYTPDNCTTPKPTIIIGNGFDGSQEELYHQIGKAALDRGYNVITYDGPGQPGPRRWQTIGFILEWEKVVTPVVDYLFTLPEVDTSAIALIGLSFGGFLAPRAAAFEHRLAAVMAIDGIDDFGGEILGKFGDEFTALVKNGNKTAVNAIVASTLASPTATTETKWFLGQGIWSFMAESPYDFLKYAAEFSLGNLTDLIPGPIFVADSEDDGFFAGAGKVLADKLGNRSTYHLFKSDDGAGEHCALGAMVLQNEVVFDWFQNILDSK